MIRCMKLSRKLNSCRLYLHTYKSQELDQPAYFKKEITPEIISLVKKYEDDIHYSSFIELNKKPLSYKQRMELMNKLQNMEYKMRMKEATESEPSILARRLVKIVESKESSEKGTEEPESKDNETPAEEAVDDTTKTTKPEERLALARVKLKILTEMGLRRSALDYEQKSFPDNWMEDYETFRENGQYFSETHYGTPDPTVPISKVSCHGCGSKFQCADTNLPGYLPSELMRDKPKSILTKLICQRCHFLKHYNTALKVQVSSEDYVNMISCIKNEKALAVLMVDLVDFPASIWPNIIDIIGENRPVIVVGNKVDLLPQDSKNYLKHIINCLEQCLIDAGLEKANIKHLCLVSAQTNYGIEELITSLYTYWPNKGNVYLIGNANVGKSTLFNALLRSDYCKIRARDLIRRATSSLWPGTTLNMLKFPIARPSGALLHMRRIRLKNAQKEQQELDRLRRHQIKTGSLPETTLMDHIGLSYQLIPEAKVENEVPLTDAPPYEKWFNERHGAFRYSKWLYDTPGVIQNEQIINFLTSEELLLALPKKTLWPRVFYILPGQTLFLSGLGRIDYIGGASEMRLSVFASEKLSILITNTEKADHIFQQCLGTELINVPRGDTKRIQDFPPLVRHKEKISVSNPHSTRKISICDIVLSSAGWVSINIPPTEMAHFHAWTPDGRGIFVRKPSLLPWAASVYRGKRMKYTPAYEQKEPSQITH